RLEIAEEGEEDEGGDASFSPVEQASARPESSATPSHPEASPAHAPALPAAAADEKKGVRPCCITRSPGLPPTHPLSRPRTRPRSARRPLRLRRPPVWWPRRP